MVHLNIDITFLEGYFWLIHSTPKGINNQP